MASGELKEPEWQDTEFLVRGHHSPALYALITDSSGQPKLLRLDAPDRAWTLDLREDALVQTLLSLGTSNLAQARKDKENSVTVVGPF